MASQNGTPRSVLSPPRLGLLDESWGGSKVTTILRPGNEVQFT